MTDDADMMANLVDKNERERDDDLWSKTTETNYELEYTVGQNETNITGFYIYYQGDFISKMRERRYPRWTSCGDPVLMEVYVNRTRTIDY